MTRKGFSYQQLDPSASDRVRAITEEIHELDIRLSVEALAAGRLLAEARSLLPHGSFLPWCETEFNWNAGVVRRLKRIWKFFGNQNGRIVRFDVSALQILSVDSVPAQLREMLVAEAVEGKPVTYSRARTAINDFAISKPSAEEVSPGDPSLSQEHTVWQSIAEMLRGGGTVGLCVSPDADNPGDAIVSAWVATDDGHRKNAVRSSLGAAVLAIAGKEERKICTVCQQEHPLEWFSRKGKQGHASACKICERKRVKRWKAKKSAKGTNAAL